VATAPSRSRLGIPVLSRARKQADFGSWTGYFVTTPWLRQTVKTLFAVRCKFIVPHPERFRMSLPGKRRRAMLASNPIEE
jgi:hypothetical protein